MKSIYLFSLVQLWLIPYLLMGQNLVPNPSFEEYLSCPETFTKWNTNREFLKNWSYPTKGTPDYFNACSRSEFTSVPQNFAGYAQPKTGNAYVGIVALGTRADYREYIQTELISSLEAGKKYCVSFFYMIAPKSAFTINQLGINLNTEKIETDIQTNLKLKPQVKHPINRYLESDFVWDSICDIYTATGGEKFLNIGNFEGPLYTRQTTIKNKSPHYKGSTKDYTYIYIDDVSVTPMTDCGSCICVQSDLHVQAHGKAGEVRVMAEGGTKPYSYQWSNGSVERRQVNLPAGVYFVAVTDAVGCIVKDSVRIVASVDTTAVVVNTIEDKLIDAKIGTSIILDNVTFKSGSSELMDESYEELDILVNYMLTSDIQRVEITGHTDNIGNEQYNLLLSQQRAQTVVDYIITKGINDNRLISNGYGSSRPMADNNTADGRKRNRRVEFKVVE